MEEPEASWRKNLTGGAGCGCGCIGATAALLGGALLVALPLGMYLDEGSAPIAGGIGLIAAGLLTVVLGIVIYVGSLFLE